MAKRDNDPGARPDEDNPEWMAAAVKKARPALDVVSEVFGPDVADELRRGRGRPAKADRKVNQTLRLDADVLEAYRQAGKGWQTRINQVLREHMQGNQKKIGRANV